MKRTPGFITMLAFAGAGGILALLLALARSEWADDYSPDPDHQIVLTIGKADRSLIAAGDSLREKFLFREAIDVYRRALETQGMPASLREEAEYDIGLSLLRLGEYHEAEAVFRRLLEGGAENPKTAGQARYCLAWMAMQGGKAPEAAAFLKKASPEEWDADSELAIRVRLLDGRISRALSPPGEASGPPHPVMPPLREGEGAMGLIPPAAGGPVLDLPVDVFVEEMCFAHGGEGSALDIRVDGGRDIPVPEYRVYPFRSEAFACSAGTEPVVLVKLRAFPPAPAFLTIDAITPAGGARWNLRSRAVRFGRDGYSIGDTGAPEHFVRFRAETASPAPAAAGRWVLVWNWRVTSIGGKPCTPFSLGDTIHRYYTIPGTPVKPMGEPWTAVLDRSCGWASGSADAEGCLRALAENLNSCGAEWNTVQGYTRDGRLDLERLLGDLEDPPANFRLNCVDFSSLFAVLAASLGISCTCRSIVPVPPASSFRTRHVLPAGRPNRYDNWQVMDFGLHRVCEWNGRIIDPSLRLHAYPSVPPDPVDRVRISSGDDPFYGPFPESYRSLFLEYPESAALGEPETVELLE